MGIVPYSVTGLLATLLLQRLCVFVAFGCVLVPKQHSHRLMPASCPPRRAQGCFMGIVRYSVTGLLANLPLQCLGYWGLRCWAHGRTAGASAMLAELAAMFLVPVAGYLAVHLAADGLNALSKRGGERGTWCDCLLACLLD
jgi:hypothetical protein